MEYILWKCIRGTSLKRKQKHRLFLALNVVCYGILGYILWLLLGERIFVNRAEWLTSFIGYPAVLGGFLSGIMFLFKKDQ